MLVWRQPLQHLLPQSSNWVSEFVLPLCEDLNASGVVMSGECLPVMWLAIFFEQMLSFPATVKWISGDALVSLLIFWYENSRTNSGERLYYLFLAALEGNSGSGRGEEPEPQQVSAAEAAERDGQSVVMEAVAGTKESQTSREIKQWSRFSQKPASEINSLRKMTD